jgi:hypothetical protein
MMKNDLTCMLPDENGVRVCSLALRELSRFAILLVDKVEGQGSEESKHEETTGKAVNVGELLTLTHGLVDSVNELLSFCRNHEDDLPPSLDLTAPAPETLSDPNNQLFSQYKNMLSWETAALDADPGQELALRKYIPVDLLQVGSIQHMLFLVRISLTVLCTTRSPRKPVLVKKQFELCACVIN